MTAQIDQEERPVAGVGPPSYVVAQMILHRNVISLSATAAGARIGSLLLIPALYKRGLQSSPRSAWPTIPKSDGAPESKKPHPKARLSA